MKPLFQKIKVTRPGTNNFDLSHEKKLSCQMGELIPMMVQEIVPGDKFRVNTEVFARLAPMLAPVMHRVNISTHYFFVPNRLIFDKWEDFITGGENGLANPVLPQINMNTNYDKFGAGSLADYMGIPHFDSMSAVARTCNALPFRAYQLIYNEYYRDQNLQSEIDFSKGEGILSDPDAVKLLTMRKRCWEKDYYTSALPWAQKGGEVLMPLSANVTYKTASNIIPSSGSTPFNNGGNMSTGGVSLGQQTVQGLVSGSPANARIENIASIDNATTTINDLRRASRLQEWLEKNARGGSRYIEQIFSHFGVKSSDARLQRPEYLGGSKQPIVISEVLSTYTQTGDAPQGNMSGHGISVGSNPGFTKFFEEHGFVMGVMSILPRTSYQQGLPRIFGKFDRFDYYYPEFANIGEQEVWNKEVYFDVATSDAQQNDGTFGYQSRYAEYKFANSSVHGDFRTNMNYWHMGRIFSGAPALNSAFVTADPTQRIFAVTDTNVDKVYIQLFNDVKAIRPMPVFGTPSF